MTFELDTLTKTKITDVVVLSQKNRAPGDNPGASLDFSVTLSNDALTHFDGSLKSFLYTKSAASSSQEELDGVDPISDTPNLTPLGMKLGKLSLNLELTGYELTIDHGLGGKSNVVLEDCVVSGFKLDPKEGGSFVMTFTVESQDVPEGTFGKLATMKNTEVQILLVGPDLTADNLELPA